MNSTLPTVSTDYGYTTDSGHLSTDFNSTLTTPSTVNFDSQSFFQTNAQSQFYSEDQQWNNDSNESPIRESLDARIEHLLRSRRGGFAHFLSEVDLNEITASFNATGSFTSYRRNNQKKIDESEAILGTPPSPFTSASDYFKWHKITKQIDAGQDPEAASSDDDQESDEAQKNVEDDHMSMSSLSSGDKGESIAITTSSNPLYPSDVQVMARLGLLKRETGSTFSSFFQSKNAPNFNGSLMHSFVFNQTFMPQGGSQGLYTFQGFSGPSLGCPADIFKQDSPTGDDMRLRFNRNNELLFNDLLAEALKKCIKDLKEILTKDIYKKIVENFSFKMFDQWWEESERASQKTSQESSKPGDGELVPTDTNRRCDINIPLFNPLFEHSIHSRQEQPIVPNFEFGLTRGLRAAMPKLPSFKRKIIKTKPSPSHSFDDKLSDISDDEDEIRRSDRKYRHDRDRDEYDRRRRRRRAHSISSQSSRSSSRSSSSSSSTSSSSSGSSSGKSDSDSTSSSDDSDQSSGSDSDSSSTSSASSKSFSTISSKSTRSSRLSRKSRTSSISKKSPSASPLAVPKIQSDLSEISDESFDSDGTATCDEFIEELEEDKKHGRLVSSLRDLDPSLEMFSKSLETDAIMLKAEIEASQALMALAGFATAATPTASQVFNGELAAAERAKALHDFISHEHSYCRPVPVEPEIEVKPVPILPVEPPPSKGKVGRPKKEKENKENQDKKSRKRKKDEVVVDENLQPNMFAVASEWRKAKRKNVVTEIDQLLVGEQDENKLVEPKPPKPEPKPITFPQRDLNGEMALLYEFLQNGIDAEDIRYLKRSYDQLLQEDSATNLGWINDIHWVDHPPTALLSHPLPKKKRRTEELPSRVHKSGCARTEGFYKLQNHEKIKFSHVMANAEDEAKNARARKVASKQQQSREARSNQRRLLATADFAITDLLKFNQLKVSWRHRHWTCP